MSAEMFYGRTGISEDDYNDYSLNINILPYG